MEDKSTNCGANAVESKKLLDLHENEGRKGEEKSVIEGRKKRILLIQDPTMSLRTQASFQQVYSSLPLTDQPEIICYPGFIPKVKISSDFNDKLEEEWVVENLEFDLEEGIREGGVWGMHRFLDLIMGEIPRFEMYGPRGKGSIVDVHVPESVREAWERLDLVIGKGRER